MSFIGSAKEFFGFGPYDEGDDAYYDDHDYRAGREYGHAERGERAEVSQRGEYGSRAERAEYGVRETRSFTPEIVSVAPRSYNDAKEIGEPFRDGDAVVMDLSDLDAADAKRVIDFAAGLCFALRGSMQNLTRNSSTQRRVFAIVPENGRITSAELKRAARLD